MQTLIEHIHRMSHAVPLSLGFPSFGMSFFLCSRFRRVKSSLSLAAAQVPSPAGQQVNSVPLEQTPAEEESRKSISRSFKGTMASSTERRQYLFLLNRCISLHFLFLFVCCDQCFNVRLSSPACEDVLTPAAVAESAMKVLNSCLATMPAGRTPIRLNYKDCKSTFGQQHHNNKLLHGGSMCLN